MTNSDTVGISMENSIKYKQDFEIPLAENLEQAITSNILYRACIMSISHYVLIGNLELQQKIYKDISFRSID